MTEPQLPTPTAGDAKSARNRTAGRSNPDSKHHDGVTLTDALTSASSPGSGDSTSPLSGSGSSASARSNGTSTAPLFSNDGGPESQGGETFTSSAMLPTPRGSEGSRMARYRQGGHPPLSVVASLASPHPLLVEGPAPQTIAGSGLSSPVWLASYDPGTSSWRTSQVSLLSTEDERFPRSWERWPTSGMTRRGQAFGLRMSERPTAESGSSFLRTPRASRGSSSTENQKELLPTPTTRDHKGRDLERQGGQSLPERMHSLLPTPAAGHSRGLAQPGTDYQSLPNAILSVGELTNPPSEGGKP